MFPAIPSASTTPPVHQRSGAGSRSSRLTAAASRSIAGRRGGPALELRRRPQQCEGGGALGVACLEAGAVGAVRIGACGLEAAGAGVTNHRADKLRLGQLGVVAAAAVQVEAGGGDGDRFVAAARRKRARPPSCRRLG